MRGKIILLIVLLCAAAGLQAAGGLPQAGKKKVYLFPIKGEILPSTVKLTGKCLKQARDIGADYIVIDMNTYGGLVDAADSVRTALLECPVPVIVFVNNQAASAGALIALAADSIYMREGASMGSATVVDPSGAPLPDKYQSFMRSMMRATAETHGKVEVATAKGDSVLRWRRDPRIAEAMVDPLIIIPGLIDSLHVIALTPEEAIKWRYCEGKASSVTEVLSQAGIMDYQITEYKPTLLDMLLALLMNPAIQGILILLMVGGIYFEFHAPGTAFPIIIAVLAAALYFAPLYAEGLAANWEVALFIVGVIMLFLEIFVIPGFGVTGVLGILSIVVGLAFAMIDTSMFKYITSGELSVWYVLRPVLVVFLSATMGLCLCLWLGPKFLKGNSRMKKRVVLTADMAPDKGYISHPVDRGLEGMCGLVTAVLKPAGRIIINGRYYEAVAQNGFFIEKGAEVTIVREEGGVLYCRRA